MGACAEQEKTRESVFNEGTNIMFAREQMSAVESRSMANIRFDMTTVESINFLLTYAHKTLDFSL
jgi:hypothetical protein